MKKLIVLIMVSAFMILTIQTPLAAPTLAQSSEPECWAVIVGISDYQYISDLDYADDGARELYERLGPVWGEENIRLLLDEECTKNNIMAALDWLADRDNPDDTVLFYFSGHGDSGYIAPYNASYESTWISSDELDDRLDNLEAEKIVTILDTCYAGEFEGVLRDDGRLVLMSSRSTETTVETQTLENGVFSYFILVALEQFDDADTNHDYILSAEEVFQYAEQKTVSYTTPLLIEQHPVLSDSYPGELGLLVKFIFGTNLDIRSVLTVDGEIIQSASPWFIWYPGSIHQIEVPSFIDEGDSARLAFISWDDSVTSTSRVVQSGVYTANYQRQYLLAIESAYGEPGGAGWYDEDSNATISIESIQEPTVRRHFTGWSGNYTGNEKTVSFVMGSPKTVKANWRSEYLLAIESAYGEPGGAGWYDEGSTTTISVPENVGVLVRHLFTGWSGDVTSGAPTAMLVVDSPVKVTAEWRTDYTYLILLIVGVVVIIGILAATIIMLRRHSKKAV